MTTEAIIKQIQEEETPFKPTTNVDFLVPLDNAILTALIDKMSAWEYYEQAHKIQQVLQKKIAGIYK